jgi:hypothetical protein
MPLTREQEQALAAARTRARQRMTEEQADGRPWERFRSQDTDLMPWDRARLEQQGSEDSLKPWERAKREQEEAELKSSEPDIDEAFLWAAARKRKAEAEQGQASEGELKPWERAKLEQEDTSEARVQAEFEAMNPLHKAGRATMDIARLGLDGASFGFGDKLLAGIEAAGRPDMDYDEALQLHRQATGDAKARAGLAGTVTEIGAGFLPMNAAANAGLSATRLVP